MRYTTSTNTWNYSDLDIGGSALAESDSGLTTFILSGNPHIVYFNSEQHVSELWYSTTTNVWYYEDLDICGSVLPEPGSALASFVLSDGPHTGNVLALGKTHVAPGFRFIQRNTELFKDLLKRAAWGKAAEVDSGARPIEDHGPQSGRA